MSEADSRLSEYTIDEWWKVARAIDPSLTREEFDRDWADFQRAKKYRH